MSTLSERDGLEDVFLSIHTNHNKLYRLKEISNLIVSKQKRKSLTRLIKQANYGVKKAKVINFLDFLIQKKKNLSK